MKFATQTSARDLAPGGSVLVWAIRCWLPAVLVGVVFLLQPPVVAASASDKGSDTPVSASGKFAPPPAVTASSNQSASIAALMKALDLKQTGPGTFMVGKVIFDQQARTVTIPAQVNPGQSLIEYALVTAKGKAHESLFVTEALPQQVHLACLLLGMGQGKLIGAQDQAEQVPATNAVQVEVTWDKHGPPARHPLEKLVALKKAGTDKIAGTLADGSWFYNGSEFGPEGFLAEMEGSIIALIRDPAALVNNPRATRDNDDLHVPNKKLLPKEGTPVKIILRLPSLSSTNSAAALR